MQGFETSKPRTEKKQREGRQKWLEAELESARQELRDTVRQQQGMIFKFIKRNGKFIHTLCDGELLYRLGLTPENIIGKELGDFLCNKDAEEIYSYYRKAWEGEENVTYEDEMNGIWYYASLRPIRRNGKVVEVIGSCVDITKRKESEERYRKVVEFSPKGIVIHRDGTILYANPAALNIVKETNLVGKCIFTYMLSDFHDIIKKRIAQSKIGKAMPIIEEKVTRADGEVIYAEIGGVGINYDGSPATLVMVSDITERKQAEEYLRKSEKLSVVGQLAAGVAHEIRNPLTSIKGLVQLQKEIGKPCYTDIILSEIHRLEEIVNDFLSLAKPHTLQNEKVDIKSLLDEVVRLFDAQAILKNVEVVTEFCLDQPFLYCSGNHIKQVFINILQNAVEAMPHGGVIKIQVLQNNPDSVLFRFIDQGIGISKERMKKIGEPFYSTKEKGTGLGLMVSQKIIREHGGTINLKSTLNKGTTVEVVLPMKHPSPDFR